MHTNGREVLPSAAVGPQKKFVSGVGVLSVATLISKMIGLFYRIPLVSVIGIGGMAYFLAANHLYITLYLVFAAGLPSAIAVLVSERRVQNDHNGAVGVYRTALSLFFALGAIFSFALFFFSESIAVWIGLPGAARSLMVIAPTLMFSCISSAIRGYFQGYEKMLPTAVSEVIESAGKLIFGLIGATYASLQGYSKDLVSAFAVFGVTIGVFLSTLYLVISKLLFDRKCPLCSITHGKKSYFSALLCVVMPMTCSAVVLSLVSVVDTVLIPTRLRVAGVAEEMVEMMYSSYGNLALPLYNLPTSLITPIALALVPMLSAARRIGGRKDEEGVTGTALRLTVLLAIPASFGLAIFSFPILRLLYPNEEAVVLAAPLLSLLAVSVLLSSLITVTNAMLIAYGNSCYAMLSMLCGAVVKVFSEYVLVGLPSWNIYGAPISTFFCGLTVCVINLGFVLRKSKMISGVFGIFLRPTIAALPAVGIAAGVYLGLLRSAVFSSSICILPAMAVAVMLYAIFALWNGALGREELMALPLPKGIRNWLCAQELKKDKEKGRSAVLGIADHG